MCLVSRSSSICLIELQQHPNEYIRGATLRFLQKISKDAELLEPLIPTCRSCLKHRHSYMRKNAVFAVYTIYRQYKHLIPDGPELVQTFLAVQTDAACKRNAFVFFANCAMPKAVEYVLSVHDSRLSMGRPSANTRYAAAMSHY